MSDVYGRNILRNLAAAARSSGRCGWAAAALALCGALLWPLLLVDVPPLLDYPNHLARAYLLATLNRGSVFAPIYSIRWDIIPNIAVDLVLPPLLHVLPPHVAGRVVLGGVLLLPVIGTIAYSRALFGMWSWWPLASGLIAYNALLLSGFLNFTAGVGLALLVAAGWLEWRERRPLATAALASVGTVTLFFFHLMGLVFCLVLIASAELAWAVQVIRAGSRRWHAVGLRWALLGLVLVGPALLYAVSDLATAQSEVHWLGPRAKLAQLLAPLVNYDRALDIATACVVAGFVVLCVALRRAVVPPCSVLAFSALSLLYAASPFEFKGTAALDTRFAIMLGFAVCACVRPVLSRRADTATAGALAMLFALRMGVLASAWHEHRADLADLRSVIALVPPGSRVYLTSVAPADDPGYWRLGPRSRLLSDGTRTEYHVPALLLIERQAFWPYLFTQRAQQPITVAPRFHALAMQTLALPDSAFVATCRSSSPPAATPDVATLAAALCGYDYVLMLEAGAVADLTRCGSSRLQLRAKSDIAALFQVQPARLGCAPSSSVD